MPDNELKCCQRKCSDIMVHFGIAINIATMKSYVGHTCKSTYVHGYMKPSDICCTDSLPHIAFHGLTNSIKYYVKLHLNMILWIIRNRLRSNLALQVETCPATLSEQLRRHLACGSISSSCIAIKNISNQKGRSCQAAAQDDTIEYAHSPNEHLYIVASLRQTSRCRSEVLLPNRGFLFCL
jgi:hypothetical protein